MCQYMSVRVSTCQYVSVCVSTCQDVSVRVSTCQYVSVRVSTCQYVLVRISTCQYVSTHVSTSQYLSVFFVSFLVALYCPFSILSFFYYITHVFEECGKVGVMCWPLAHILLAFMSSKSWAKFTLWAKASTSASSSQSVCSSCSSTSMIASQWAAIAATAIWLWAGQLEHCVT